MILKINYVKKYFNLLLPVCIMVSQWISFKNINLSWIIYLLLIFFVIKKINIIIKNKKVLIFSLIVVFFPFASFYLGITDSFNINLYFSIISGLICMLYIYTLDDILFKWFINGCGIACVVFTFMGLNEIFYGNYFFYDFQNHFVRFLNPFGNHYPIAVFSNTNDISQFLVLLVPCCFSLLKDKKLLIFLYLIASFFVIFNTESKLSLISYVLIIILAYLIYISSVKAKGKIKSIIIAFLFISAVLLIDSYTNFISTTIEHYFNLSINSDYFVGRSNIYINLLNLSKSLPFGGFGSSYAIQVMPPHNLLLYILCDYGWSIIVLFIIFMIHLGKKMYANILDISNKNKFFYSLAFSNLLFFIILSSVSSCNEQRKAIWFFLGICIKLAFDNSPKICLYGDDLNECIDSDNKQLS